MPRQQPPEDIVREVAALAERHGLPLGDDAERVELLTDVDLPCELPEPVFSLIARLIGFLSEVDAFQEEDRESGRRAA